MLKRVVFPQCWVLVAVVVCASALPGCHDSAPVEDRGALRIEVLSNRADLISGADALVEVVQVDGTAPDEASVLLNGKDISGAFDLRANGRYQGLVTGLVLGKNRLVAKARGYRGAKITIVNHPAGGPVFAGPQIQPWICGTEAAGLGPALDAQCNAPSVIRYQYRSLLGVFRDYDPDSPPVDVAMTTTTDGLRVPYIVRVETGTLDRGIYQTAVLADPGQPWTPWAPQPGWNRKVVWVFGGGTSGHFTQDNSPSALDENALSNGFLVATGGLNVHGSNANDNVSAEAIMMLKEHIAETYGPIRHTIGTGCSGGGLQQYLIGNGYPGLLDGLIPSCSYPDLWTTAQEVFDCVALNKYFSDDLLTWPLVTQQAMVEGHSSVLPCQAWELFFGANIRPDTDNCNLPEDQVYNAETNPTGARCTLSDYNVSILGRRTAAVWGAVEQRIGQGFANRPVGNDGIQYGLKPLLAGQISPAQFVNLNAGIGCFDIDGVPVRERCHADPGSEALAYRAALVNDTRQLDRVPIIDLRGHDDLEIHTDDWSYVIRDRLVKAHGHHDNQIIFTGAVPIFGDPAFLCATGFFAGLPGINLPQLPGPCTANPVLLMARWLDAIESDPSIDSLAAKVVRNKPEDAVDTCFVAGVPIRDKETCSTLYPYFSSPRNVAGQASTRDSITCQKQPLDRADYGAIRFSDEQWAELQATFPTGVCDWTKPDAAEQPSTPWMDFSAGPGGRPLPPPPISSPL